MCFSVTPNLHTLDISCLTSKIYYPHLKCLVMFVNAPLPQPFFFNISFLFYMYEFCLCVKCTPCVCLVPAEARRVYQKFCCHTTGDFEATVRVVETKFRLSARATNNLNHWAIFLALLSWFFLTHSSFIFCLWIEPSFHI